MLYDHEIIACQSTVSGPARSPRVAENRRPELWVARQRPEPQPGGLFAAEAATPPARRIDDDFSVILFWANGGPSHLDTFDLKPDAPDEIRGPFRPSRNQRAGHADHRAPADAGEDGRQVHPRPQPAPQPRRALRRHAPLPDRLLRRSRPTSTTPSTPTSAPSSPSNWKARPGDVPLYVGNTKFYGSGPGYLGPAYAPFMPSPNPLSSTGNNTYDPVPLYLTAESQANLSLSADGAVDAAPAARPAAIARRPAAQLDRPARASGRLRRLPAPGGRTAGRPARRAKRSTCRAKTRPDPRALRRHPLGQEPADVPPAGRGGRSLRAVPGRIPPRPRDRPHQQLGRPLGQLATSSRPTRRSCRTSTSRCRR